MVKLAEDFKLQGVFSARVYKNGVLAEEIVEKNLIVNGAKDQVARLIAGDTEGRSIDRIAFGTGGAEPDAADAEIENQYARPVNGFSYPAMGQVQIDWSLPISECNGMAIMEFGLLTADGTLFARRTRANPIHKESDISIEGSWTIIL